MVAVGVAPIRGRLAGNEANLPSDLGRGNSVLIGEMGLALHRWKVLSEGSLLPLMPRVTKSSATTDSSGPRRDEAVKVACGVALTWQRCFRGFVVASRVAVR